MGISGCNMYTAASSKVRESNSSGNMFMFIADSGCRRGAIQCSGGLSKSPGPTGTHRIGNPSNFNNRTISSVIAVEQVSGDENKKNGGVETSVVI